VRIAQLIERHSDDPARLFEEVVGEIRSSCGMPPSCMESIAEDCELLAQAIEDEANRLELANN